MSCAGRGRVEIFHFVAGNAVIAPAGQTIGLTGVPMSRLAAGDDLVS